MNILIKWLVSALALLVASSVLPGIEVTSLYIALLVALFLGFFNTLVKPILFVLTLPINVMTLGLFTFVINGLIFWFVASFIEGFIVDGFLWAVLGAIFVSAFSWAANQLFDSSEKKRKKPNASYNGNRDASYYHVDSIEKPKKDDKK